MEKPKLIFKYTRLNDDTKNALRESYLWFCPAKNLNDPFDLQYRLSDDCMLQVLEQIKDELRTELKKQPEANMDIIEIFMRLYKTDRKFRDYMMKSLRQKASYSVCCFTESADDILMWSHYGSNHSGICLMYDLQGIPNLWNTFRRVTYSEKYPVCDNYDEVNLIGIFTKSPHWGYEREWRMVNFVKSGKESIDKKCLKGIIFGCKTSDDDENELVKICKEAGYENLQYFKMRQSETEYKLDKMKRNPKFELT